MANRIRKNQRKFKRSKIHTKFKKIKRQIKFSKLTI